MNFILYLGVFLLFSPITLSILGLEKLADSKKIKPIRLEWKFSPNDIVEVQKYSNQNITWDNRKINQNIYQRILLEEKGKSGKDAYLIDASFDTRVFYKDSKIFEQEKFERSQFSISRKGKFAIDSKFFMPNIRSLPLFLDKPLKQGMTWKAPGEQIIEVNLGRKILIPLEIHYEYRGFKSSETKDGVKSLYKILVRYRTNYHNTKASLGAPVKIIGFSNGIWFWDALNHIPYFVRDESSLMFIYKSGSVKELKINSKSFYQKIKGLSDDETQKLANKLKDKLSNVRIDKNSIRIILDNTIIKNDLKELTSETEDKLDLIIATLENYPQLHLLVQEQRDFLEKKSDEKKSKKSKMTQSQAQMVTAYLTQNSNRKREKISYKNLSLRKKKNSIFKKNQNYQVEIIIELR